VLTGLAVKMAAEGQSQQTQEHTKLPFSRHLAFIRKPLLANLPPAQDHVHALITISQQVI